MRFFYAVSAVTFAKSYNLRPGTALLVDPNKGAVIASTVSCPSVRNSVIAEFQPLFFSKISLSGLVFDGVVALVGAALCLLFVQNLTHTQALSLAEADSAVSAV